MLNQQIKGCNALYQSTRESRGSHLHLQSNTRIHFLPRKSRIHCKFKSSNVQCYNLVPLVLLLNSYWFIVPGRTPNLHLIPSGNANDQKKSSHDLPFSAIQSLEKSGHPFCVVTHLPSFVGTLIVGSPSLGKASSHQKIQKLGHIPTLKSLYRS